MFADGQVAMAGDENTMQRALYKLYKITNTYNHKITTENIAVMAFMR
jgi:hypothetical protein